MSKLYWENFTAGDTETIGMATIRRDEIIAFAKQYDPQPFHLDEELAKNSFVGQLCASGWQVVTLFSRIIYESYEKNTAIVGAPHIEECRWIKPVFPNDELTCNRTCLEVKTDSADEGLCRFRWELFDQHGEQKTQIIGWNRIKKNT